MSDGTDASPSRVAVIAGRDVALVQHVLSSIPDTKGLAIVVVGPRADELDGMSGRVVDARVPVPVTANQVYVIPADVHAEYREGQLQPVPHEGFPMPADSVMRTVADHLGAACAGVLLSSAATDGPLGLKRIKEVGGLTVVPRSSEPATGAIASLLDDGVIDIIVDLADIGSKLMQLTLEAPARIVEDEPDAMGEALRDVLALVRVRTGNDFSSYKRATLLRRVARRMQARDLATLSDYHRYLRENPSEVSHLLKDFLISVTNFFRDREAFAALEREVIPRLFAGKTDTDQVRVWVPGCATGEEAYSIAILLAEYASTLREPPQLQVFATDIDEGALAHARAALYADEIALDVSPARLARFFTVEGGYHRLTKEIREIVLFSPHNLLRDPPFSRLDLISCRNLLIYLNKEAQERALKVFHFALRQDGWLFLGSSESAEASTLFTPTDLKNRLFARRLAPPVAAVEPMVTGDRWVPPTPSQAPAPAGPRATSFGELHHRVVERYAPPSVLVNGELAVVHLSEHVGRFLQVSGGEPSRELLHLVHPALRLDLRTAIYSARQTPGGTDARIVHFEEDGVRRAVELRVRALEMPDLGRGAMLVMFDELPPREERAERSPPALEPVVRELEEELRHTRAQLRNTVEQYETSLEELKASNEELQAINEELRSATEELETSKEELQSVNEELTTLNHELKQKIDEVMHANADLQNLMTSTDIGVVFLDRALNIKRFTPRVRDVINVIPSDIGRPLSHLTHVLATDELSALARSVLSDLRVIKQEMKTRDGRQYLLRMLPYRSPHDRIDGVVITLVETTELHAALTGRAVSEANLRTVEERLHVALRAAPMLAIAFDGALEPTWAYHHGAEIPARGPELAALFADQHLTQLGEACSRAIATHTALHVEVALVIDGRARTYLFVVEPGDQGAIAVGLDVTPIKLAEQSLIDADRRKDEFLATLAHELRNPLTPIKIALDVAKLSTPGSSQLTSSLAIIERQTAQLSFLVEELLDVAKIAQGKLVLDRRPVEPAALIEAALETVRPAIQQKRQHLDVVVPTGLGTLIGDQARLVQVLTNLLTNATKFTPEDGRIGVSVERSGRIVRVRVRDTGVGIPSDMLERIFDIYVQSRDERGRAVGGLGVGLNVVRRLVELHGGTVRATSDGPGHGAEFTVELPTDGGPR